MEVGRGKRIAGLGLEGDEARRIEDLLPLAAFGLGEEMEIGRHH